MWTIMYNYKGEWIHNDTVNYMPTVDIDSIIDFGDVHYNIARIIIQPGQRRYKIFLEQV